MPMIMTGIHFEIHFVDAVTTRSTNVLISHHSPTVIRTSRLKSYGNIAYADQSMDHSRALGAGLGPLQADWNLPCA